MQQPVEEISRENKETQTRVSSMGDGRASLHFDESHAQGEFPNEEHHFCSEQAFPISDSGILRSICKV